VFEPAKPLSNGKIINMMICHDGYQLKAEESAIKFFRFQWTAVMILLGYLDSVWQAASPLTIPIAA
jgi:hypothetical protein